MQTNEQCGQYWRELKQGCARGAGPGEEATPQGRHGITLWRLGRVSKEMRGILPIPEADEKASVRKVPSKVGDHSLLKGQCFWNVIPYWDRTTVLVVS